MSRTGPAQVPDPGFDARSEEEQDFLRMGVLSDRSESPPHRLWQINA
jgi:hypothetical protein